MKAGQAGSAMNAHHLEEARKLYAELAVAYPREPNVHYAYGYLLAFLDQEEAIVQFQKELELTPSHVPSMVQASFLYLKLGQLDDSRELARRAMKLDPKNYAPHNILGRIFVEEKQYARGIVELETAGKLAPRHPGNHFNLAQAYQRAGRKADAAREFAAFNKLNQQPGGQGASAAKP
jgi:tetratricopeptide (TPR) repeat protein